MPLDNDFVYTGGGILIKMCYHRPGPAGGSSAFTYFGLKDATRAFSINSSYGTGLTNMTCGDNTIHPDYSNFSAGDVRPNFRFGIDGLIGAEFKSANCFHSNRDTIPVGAQNVEILGTKIVIDGKDATPIVTLTSMTFDGKTSNIVYAGQVTNARLYYTGGDSVFSRTQQVGQQININSTNDLNNMTFNTAGLNLPVGEHFF